MEEEERKKTEGEGEGVLRDKGQESKDERGGEGKGERRWDQSCDRKTQWRLWSLRTHPKSAKKMREE